MPIPGNFAPKGKTVFGATATKNETRTKFYLSLYDKSMGILLTTDTTNRL